jgi:arylsulfatase A
MTRRPQAFLVQALAAALVVLSPVAALAAVGINGPRPNIIFILADDLGYGDLAFQNPRSRIATPHLDGFAAEGIRFTDAHSPSAVCTPTRYGILTGRYCWRSSLKRGVLGGFSPPLLETNRLTVPALLRQHGYATACIGKWHLGMTWPRTNSPAQTKPEEHGIDFSRPIADGPCDSGFDYFFGISASLDMPPYVLIENRQTVALPAARQEKASYVRAGPKDPEFRFEEVLPRLVRRSVAFIGEQAKEHPGRPFFLYLALNAPHTPIVPSDAFKGRSPAGDYGDFVTQVDSAVGEILQAIDRHELARSTLVIVTSDNGPETLAYERARQRQHYSMGDWRGVKRDAWEGGHRVPFLARWRGRIKPGSVNEETLCLTDLMATVAAIVGARLPVDAGEDSYSVLPALLGEKSNQPLRKATVYHTGSGQFALRQGPWVFIDAPTGDNNKEPPWFRAERGFLAHQQPGELYDLSQDPGQRKNLYAEQPERVRQLKALLEEIKAGGRSAPR